MGIDPGTNRAGYGVIRVSGNKVECVCLGDIELHKYTDPYLKLARLFTRVSELIDSFAPDEVALESPFFGQNVQSMLKLGRAQGVAMAAALAKGLTVSEYAPRRVKQAVTGQGAASKEQVAALMQSFLKFDYDPKRLDATDGLAVALCHYFTSNSALEQGKTAQVKPKRKSSSWESFLSANPDREIK
ncbi:MAG: crossover junction endodeoxyribonuclease RuvC [Rikenellaceae bacterium]